MSLEVNESISSFVDSELDVSDYDNLVNNLHENEEQKKVLERYCVIGDAIKRNLPESMNHNLLERVQNALESEPALLAPAPNQPETELPEAEIFELPKKSSPKSSFKPAFGFGIAASLTLAVVLGFQMTNESSDSIQQIVVSPNLEPATQQINIASKSTSVNLISPSSVVDEMPTNNENVTYAEQSLIDDGQWTRITQMGDVPLESHISTNGAEAHVLFNLPNEKFPFARSVNLGNKSAE